MSEGEPGWVRLGDPRDLHGARPDDEEIVWVWAGGRARLAGALLSPNRAHDICFVAAKVWPPGDFETVDGVTHFHRLRVPDPPAE